MKLFHRATARTVNARHLMNASLLPGLSVAPLLGVSVGWFDPLFLLLLALGCWRGRLNGAAREHFAVGQWFLVAVMGGVMSRALGGLMVKWLGVTFFAAGIFGYVVGGGLVLIVAAVLRTYHADEMLDAAFFGKAEPAAGGVFGALKFFCLLTIPLAFVHARKVPDPADPRTFHETLHVQIFDRSLAGAALDRGGAFLLIPASSNARRPTVGQKKNQQMNKVGK